VLNRLSKDDAGTQTTPRVKGDRQVSERRILIVDADLIDKIDANRNDMSRTEFLSFLMDSYLRKEGRAEDIQHHGDAHQAREEVKDLLKALIADGHKKEIKTDNYVTREELQQVHDGIRDLLRSFLDFFVTYGLEIGKQPQDSEFQELGQKLQALDRSMKRR
jgi:hypothetical protein